MDLHIAGFKHFDPTGRTRLRQWLEQLSTEHTEPPAFVAVEWDEDLFGEVKAQRASFRNLITQEWPFASPGLLDELELSLGYGGDTHTGVFPDVPVIWLDQGRRCDVSCYASKRLDMYKSFLGEEGLPGDSTAALATLSQQASERADPPTKGDERDQKWTRLIIDEIAQSGGDWAIAIVGPNHTRASSGYMTGLLEEAGQLCEVTILQP